MFSTPTPRDWLMRLIELCFGGVVLGDGVSLHETVVIDNWGSDEDRQAARANDEQSDWRKLIDDPELGNIGGVGGIGFYDAAGFRFHLPAYMTLILRDPSTDAAHRRSSDLLMTLSDTGDFHRRYGKELSPQQKQCVRYFLLYMRAWRYLHYMCDSTKIDNALAKYWVDQAKDVPEKEFWGPIWPLIRGPI